MEREKLIAARNAKHWTQEEVAEMVGVDVNTYYRWEAGTQSPRGHSRRSLCNIFGMTAKELGLDNDGNIALAVPPATAKPPTFLQTDLTMQLQSLAYTVHAGLQDLQNKLKTILEEFDTMSTDKTTRREALKRLATLPFLTLHLNKNQAITFPRSTPAEIINHCAAAITACWELSRSKEHEDLELVFEAVSAYFTVLAPIVKDSSLYRQEAAKLAAECAIMKTMLGWHLEGPRGTFPAAQDAQVYARESGDVALQLRALRYSSWLYQHARLSVQALKISEQARPLLKQHALSLPSRLVGGMYSTLSVMQAKAGQGQDAVTSSRKAAVAFCTQTSADSELLTYRGDFSTASLALNDGLMYYANRDYSKALDSLQPLINLDTLHLKMPLPERNRIEAINLIALTELKSKNRDMEHITHCWTTAIKGAKQLQSEQRFTESLVAYEIMEGVWPDDARIEELRELIVHW